ncbi:tetratricopeptide repeat protein, partial [Bauldia litoralis]|uniref:tetratricopeptide repeat protein n=1 Tax=Bauldia litoralis TaxID=665467 RepID=UPI0032989676
GEDMLAAGDTAGAAERFAAVLAAEPQSVPATAGLVQCLVASGDLDRARQALDQLPESAAGDPKVVAARAQLDLATQAASLGDESPLEARLAADPNDHQARFDLALLRNEKGDREAAADGLLEIMAKNRSWEDEKARKQLLTFFEAWGPKDDATLSGRRRLSSMLFS